MHDDVNMNVLTEPTIFMSQIELQIITNIKSKM